MKRKNPTIIAGLFVSLLCSNFKDMTKVMQIPLTQGKVALVDEADFQTVNKFRWHASKREEGVFCAKSWDGKTRSTVYMHRLIMGITDPKIQVDHRDGDTLNNQRENLRVATSAQNCANRGPRRNTSSKYRGVSKHKYKGLWRADIDKGSISKYLGLFPTEEEAALAYNKAALELHGEFARPNIISTNTP